MCLKPVYIKNPKYCATSYSQEYGAFTVLPDRLGPSTEYIQVPCGKCEDCRQSYYNSILQRALGESMSSYLYFVTLTYDNHNIPSLTLPDGTTVFYSDYHDVQNMIKRFRAANLLDRDFRYLSVNEYGDCNCRPHVHLILFVAKKDTDTVSTPLFIRDVIFRHLGDFFANNLGTRKNPVYKKLFTYSVRVTPKGLFTNYFVKYVDPCDTTTYARKEQDEATTYIKTIRYLIGYISKGSSFDSTVQKYLDHYAEDYILCSKLSQLLRSKVRFSKGFGCGFVDGQKHYMPKISSKASYSTLVYTKLSSELPKTFDEFRQFSPDEADELLKYISSDKYRLYPTLREALDKLSDYEYTLHCMYLHFFPKHFSDLYGRYYRDTHLNHPSISYFYHFINDKYKYHKPKVLTCSPVVTPLFKYLRDGVDEGLRQGCPYLAFRWKSQQQFTALCKYYKDRVCTSADVEQLYSRLGVENYEQWLHLFTQQLNTRKANRQHGNNIKYANSTEFISKSQKKCLISSRHLSGEALYRTLWKE